VPTIVFDNLPYLPDPQLPPNILPPSSQIVIPGHTVAIKRYQIVVWVSLAYQGQRLLPPSAARFPTILDTGTTHDFIIKEEHLRDWA
jgi:hypothetical protein